MRNLQICSLPELKILPSYSRRYKCNNCNIDSKHTTGKGSETQTKKNLRNSIKFSISYIKNNYQTALLLSATIVYILIILTPTIQSPTPTPIPSLDITFKEYLNPITTNDFENVEEPILESENIKKIEDIQEVNHCEQLKKSSDVNDKLKYAAENFGLSLKLKNFSEFFEVGNCEFFLGISKKRLTKISLGDKQNTVDIDEVYEFLLTPDNRYFVYTTPKGSLFVVNLLTLNSKRLHRSYFWYFTNSFFSVSSDSKVVYFTRGLLTDISVYSLETFEKIGEFDRDIQAISKFKAVSTNWLAVKTQNILKIFKLPTKTPIFEIAEPAELNLLIDHYQELRDL